MSYDDSHSGAGPANQPDADAHLREESRNGNSRILNAKSVPRSEPSFKPSELVHYKNLDLIPLHGPDDEDSAGKKIGKSPIGRNWPKRLPLSIEDAQDHMAQSKNIGVRLRDGQLVVDVDPRNFVDGQDSLKKMGENLQIDWNCFPTVLTGGGGKHIYMSIPPGLKLIGGHDEYPGIEFKTLGHQVVAAGSVHPETKMVYEWDPLIEFDGLIPSAPDELIALAKRKPGSGVSGLSGRFSGKQLGDMLEGLDPLNFSDHHKWLHLMMSCHHATGGSGREEFIEWSTRDPNYSDHEHIIRCRWDSLDCLKPGRSVTEKTLFKALTSVGKNSLIPRESAVYDFQNEPAADSSANAKTLPNDLSKQFVWVADAERFVRRSDTKKFNEKQFKSLYQSDWKGGDIVRAVWDAKLPIPRLESLVYIPGQPEFPQSTYAGCYNLWRPSSIVAEPGDVQVFLDHMDYLFPDPNELSYVLDYLALLVAKPDTKINFSLLVRGGQGTGKSWIGKMIAKIIGERNVSRPMNSEIISPYTDWQEGAQLAIIEELMAFGRTEVANKLKPVITDDFLRIREIYGKPYSIPNHLNLMCFTNHADALPIESGDRRWLVVFSDAKPRDQEYYKTLFDFLEGPGPAAVKDWLSNRKVDLNPKGVAPNTIGKEAMRMRSQGEAEQFLNELFDEHEAPFDFPLVRFEDIVNAVPNSIQNRSRSLRNRVTRWLEDTVGAQRHNKYSKSGDSSRPNWVLWSTQDHDHWAHMGPAGRIDAYMSNANESI